MKWLLILLFLAALMGGITLWRKSELNKATQEWTELQKQEKDLKALKKSLAQELKNQNKFLKSTKSDEFLERQVETRESEQKKVLEYISRLEQADQKMDVPLALWRQAHNRSLSGRKIEKIIPKSGPILREITFDKIENNVLHYTDKDNSPSQIGLPNLGDEAMMFLINEEFITSQVPEVE